MDSLFCTGSLLLLAIVGLLFSGCGGNTGRSSTKKSSHKPLQSSENPSLHSSDYRAGAGQFYKTPKNSRSSIPSKLTAAGDWGAISLFGEAAPRNFRGSATYGVYFTPTQRFKLSGEYLTQRLNFNFASGHTKKWVSQFAVGAEYQYLLDSSVFKSIELGTAYNHAFHRGLSIKEFDGETVKRRIGGSNASLSFLGTTLRLWDCAFLSAAADYDWVQFSRTYQNDKLSNGFGGSVDFVQRFAKDFTLNLGAEFRHPFNAYQAVVNWNHRFSYVNLDMGVFGNLTDGHDGVRDIRTIGVHLGLTFGPKPKSCGRSVEMSTAGKNCYARQYCDVSQWASTPAIYVPVVLAIADQAVIGCSDVPVLISSPTQPFSASLGGSNTPQTTNFDTALYFSGSGLTYSVSYDPLFLPSGNIITIDPTTGVLSVYNTGSGEPQNFFVTVTASNACGEASFTAQVLFQGP